MKRLVEYMPRHTYYEYYKMLTSTVLHLKKKEQGRIFTKSQIAFLNGHTIQMHSIKEVNSHTKILK